MTLKIDPTGRVSDSAALEAVPGPGLLPEITDPEAAELREHPGTGEPMTGTEHPADGTLSPEIGSHEAPEDTQAPDAAPEPAPAPAAPPRVPPRRPPAKEA